jgi:hypothetical protein
MLDELPGAERTRNYVRGLLVEHGALLRRDELAARYNQWATGALERVSTDEHRDVVRRYIRWHLQRRMNRWRRCRTERSSEFLNWLHDHGIALEELRQEHLDAWLADGPSIRRFVVRFIPWAIKSKLVEPDLAIARHRRGASPKLSRSEQDVVVERVVHSDELGARDRAAAILVIVFGQQIEDVIRLT